MLRTGVALLVSVPAAAQSPDWLKHVRGLGPWERLDEIRRVSELPVAVQRDRVPALAQLIEDEDQAVRVVAATEIAEIRAVAGAALPRLMRNFDRPHGEEGMVYVEAVAAFGEQALPLLAQALDSGNWLVRARACDAARKIRPKFYADGECKVRAQ